METNNIQEMFIKEVQSTHRLKILRANPWLATKENYELEKIRSSRPSKVILSCMEKLNPDLKEKREKRCFR